MNDALREIGATAAKTYLISDIITFQKTQLRLTLIVAGISITNLEVIKRKRLVVI